MAMRYIGRNGHDSGAEKVEPASQDNRDQRSGPEQPDELVVAPADAFLVKPYTAEELARTIAEVRSGTPLSRSESG